MGPSPRPAAHVTPQSMWMVSERANIPFAISCFLVLGMTGHDDMVTCDHNVSLQFTSIILRTSIMVEA
jgi:hypothetical protein